MSEKSRSDSECPISPPGVASLEGGSVDSGAVEMGSSEKFGRGRGRSGIWVAPCKTRNSRISVT
jgi:hypothetical protein